jgi:bifunctional UDP-N-acetylglucosamine pyrophosphorylase/glucosamine-1-phosphate N-acetyltransferase
MQTVVLAAGAGTRMRPLTATVPKPMLPVAGRPICGHVAADAAAAGATELILVVGYEADAVREYFGEEYEGVPVTFVEQTERRGTADALRAARPALDGDDFVVLNGDNLYDAGALDRLYRSGPAIGATRVDEPSNYGVLDVTDGVVSRIVEKPADPPSSLVNAGAYAFPGEAVDWLDVAESERGEYEITDVVARTVAEHAVTPVELDRWLDVGRPWELLAANEWKLAEQERRVEGDVAPDVELGESVVVEAGATVRSGVTVDGPTRICAGATVGPNAYLRGAVYVGPDAKVGHAVEVKNSVLMAGAAVPHLSYVGDSLLGPDVNLGAGTKIANLRHDDADVRLTVKGERVSTGRRKFGAVFGPGAKTGINTSVNAGVTFSPGATSAPGETVLRDR